MKRSMLTVLAAMSILAIGACRPAEQEADVPQVDEAPPPAPAPAPPPVVDTTVTTTQL
ncbi:MAG: hypothetical protein ACREMA_06480 [Longimicrobiales bacterium]